MSWIKRCMGIVSLASSLSVLVSLSMADPLPKNAKPLSSAEVREIYSGKSVMWGYRHGAYFAGNGKAISVYTNWHNDANPTQKWTGYTTGTWSTSNNQMCWRYSGFDLNDMKPFSGSQLCWKWYRAGSKFYVIQTKKPAGMRASGANDYGTNEISKLRNGDRISVWLNEYKSKAKAQ